MKRIVSSWVLFFFVLSQSLVPSARAFLPAAAIPLSTIAAPLVGAFIMSSGISAYYIKTGQYPDFVRRTVNGVEQVASAGDMMFQKAVNAYGPFSMVTQSSYPNVDNSMFVGNPDLGIGATLQQISDYITASPANTYQAWKDYLASKQTDDGQLPLPLTANDYIRMPDNTIKQASGNWVSIGGGWGIPSWVNTYYTKFGTCGQEQYFTSNNGTTVIKGVEGPKDYFAWYSMPLIPAPVGQPPTAVPGNGAIDWPAVRNDLENNPPPGVLQDAQDAIKSLAQQNAVAISQDIPVNTEDISPPYPVTAQGVQAAINGIARGAQESAAQAAAAAAAANDPAAAVAALTAGNAANSINDAALKQAEQAAAVEAAENQPPPETFDPVIAAPFETPYSPGAFDIPARFTSFLNNVQSSALFSFSSGFFNSLPGGGSPVYTVEAGQYGTHTVDLSETLGSGLAVLKTVLLLLFGFLSIRVVILKR